MVESSSKTDLPKTIPILGGLLLQALEDDVDKFLEDKAFAQAGIKKEESALAKMGFKTVSGETDLEGKFKVKKGNVPIQKGVIVKMAKDAYGEAFKAKYGDDIDAPGIGDTVMFIPGQAYKTDLEGKYLIIKDEDVMAIERG